VECIRGNWSVRELKRQIGSLYYERSGLSLDKKKLAELAQKKAETQTTLTSVTLTYLNSSALSQPR
jgi:predicted nuclease of restriction endonuclease-like (RecB) superfamily